MADLGYLLSVAPPGYANIVPGTVMTFISGTAIILRLWVWRLQARRGVVEDRGSKKDAKSEFAHVEGLGHGGRASSLGQHMLNMPQTYDYKVVSSSFAIFCPAPPFPGYWHRLSQPDLRSTGTSINFVKYQHKQVFDVCIPSAEALATAVTHFYRIVLVIANLDQTYLLNPGCSAHGCYE